MYSLLLMSALSAGPSGPEFNGFFSRLFDRDSNSGCYGSATSRSAGCTGSCSGSCHGGAGFLGHGLFDRLRAFRVGSNSCYGSGSRRAGGCTGSNYPASCCGGGCSGTIVGTPLYAPTSAPIEYAVPQATTGYGQPFHGCSGGVPAFPTYPPIGVPPPATISPPNLPVSPAPGPFAPTLPAGPDAGSVSRATPSTGPNRATVVVRLPADAVLHADGQPLQLAGAERSFVTPALPAGQGYIYSFKAEYVRDGETITQSRQATVAAGNTVVVEFQDLTRPGGATPVRITTPVTARSVPLDPAPAPVPPPAFQFPPAAPAAPAGNPFFAPDFRPASRPSAPAGDGERATITVKLPPDATLFVDGAKNGRSDPVREFNTPPLPAGREFSYVMKVERPRDGQPESQTQTVHFRAGELVTVDFTAWPGR